jgi:NAD(P)-dependent dehydrogenase (short-subunit alcohol dehydrogenase family)
MISRTFTLDDQLAFARLTGDCNPMHVDAIAARRTQYGQPVVHGMHGLFWALEAVAAQGADLSRYRGIVAQFQKPIFVGDVVVARASPSGEDMLVTIEAGGALVTRIRLSPAPPKIADVEADARWSDLPVRSEARSLMLEEMGDVSGSLEYTAPDLAGAFPNLARALGSGVLEGLAASTYVVGMELPGLHSIFSRLSAAMTPRAEGGTTTFRTAGVDPRFRLVDIDLKSQAISARIGAFARVPPVAPPGVDAIAAHVGKTEFAGQRALIVGGSRGLGATTAKILASGGAQVAITYAQGLREAQEVAADIGAHGGRCNVLPYSALCAPQSQLDQLPFEPNALYYFATGTIWQRKTRAFEPEVLRAFMRLHVEGFGMLVEALRGKVQGRLAVFYPSSVYAGDIPKQFGEYAAAKRAGEALAENLGAVLKGVKILIERLPAVDTDQNASIVATATVSPVEVMLPMVRRIHQEL